MRKTLDRYVEERLRRGLGYLLKTEAMGELALSSAAFNAAASRLARKGRVAPLRRGFVLILRPEDYVFGAPPVAQWIDPLMRHLGIDYRISLLSAAQFHGSAHQAPQEFQVIVPKQVRRLFLGRHRIREASPNVVMTQPWKLREHLFNGQPVGQKVEHERHPDAMPTDARLPMAHVRVHGDALQQLVVGHELFSDAQPTPRLVVRDALAGVEFVESFVNLRDEHEVLDHFVERLRTPAALWSARSTARDSCPLAPRAS